MRPVVLAMPEPRHDRVYRRLAGDIAAGRLAPGARLPAERRLCELFGVSRATVRRALERLREEGLIEPASGRGRVVRGGPLAEPPNALMSFTELGAARGLTASARVLRQGVRPATLEEAELFGVAPGADVFELERVRLLDGISVALDRALVPVAVAPELVHLDFTTASLYEALERAGCGLVRAAYTTEARAADPYQAEQLEVTPGFPLLYTTTTAYAGDDRVVEYGETAYRGDRYRFRATLVRSPQRRGGAPR
ncbi:MAG TPA: GntR family transcriptional regulator [Gaiellaceae bacterium]|nr:GntR family transcriptional regulator [Gaiellaceae bacterium]